MEKINTGKALTVVLYLIVAGFCLGVLLPSMVSAPDTIMSIGGVILTLLLVVMGGVGVWNKVITVSAAKKAATMLVVLLSLAACSRVPAGHVGVKVYLLGGAKGVDQEELGVGRYWIGFNEELYLFPTFTQNYVWTKDASEGSQNDESISFQSKEGMDISADVGISYRIQTTKVSTIFQKYRKGVGEITDVFLRNMVRDAFVTVASTMPVEAAYGTGKADLVRNVEQMVKAQVTPLGIVIERIYLVGKFRLPAQVIQALNNKIQATQRAEEAQNKVVQSKAEADQVRAKAAGDADAILVKATAQSKANKILNASLTASLIKYKALEVWDGTLPQVTGGATPFIDLRKK